MKTLLLVDGSSYLYRAFHAMPDLRNRQNEPTGAIYGVLNMLRKLHKDYQADYSACVFDAKGKTFRDEIYTEYKANRPSMPDDLARQTGPLREAIEAMGWPLLCVDGVEADDVIGCLAKQAEKEGMRVIISTGDKDMAQLVNEHVTLVNTMPNAFRKGDEILDVAGVEAKFGIPPKLIVDYLTLIGDSVDNVPGVEKVGPKTAVKWLQEYGSLDNIIANADKIGGAVGENLRKALPWLPTAHKLLTIRCDVGLPDEWAHLAIKSPDKAKLAELYDRFDFKTWKRELEQPANPSDTTDVLQPRGQMGLLWDAPPERPAGAPKKISGNRQYETILTDEALQQWIDKIEAAELVCLDTETTCIETMQARLVGISFAVTPDEAAYLPLMHTYAGAPQQLNFEATLERLKPLLEDPAIKKVGQNLKYDKHVFANEGIDLRGIEHDTLLQSYVLESHRSHNMDDLARRHLDLDTITYEEVAGKGAKQV
ncbi:MAG TPA: 5'-3' exonuclease H3TH domain-containing protein, partial [Methylophilaceae bacterium]|nr:5'-3' exonuclease H3TH domain-containing protein [Methylophilaceae bacterium]